MSKYLVPKLWKRHPNFFIIYFVTAVSLHLGLGLTQLVDKERYSNDAFLHLYQVAPVTVWALLSIGVFLLMTLGAYYRFDIFGRLGLAIGLFSCLARGFLIELGPASGGGLFVWFTVAALHFAQISEPTVNPMTARDL
jgi:hypothetical protein